MITRYEKVFNSPESKLRVDTAWIKSRRKGGFINPRYLYSLQYLRGNVLELGAGDGFFAHLIALQETVKHVTAVEIQDRALFKIKSNLKTVPHAESKITVVKGNIEDFTSTERFDSVHCGHTLEHVLDLEKSFDSIYKLVSDIVVISVPIFGTINRQHLREFTDVNAFRDMVKEYFEEISYAEFKDPREGSKKSSLVIVSKKRNDS